MPTLVSTYYKGKKMHGLRQKFGTTSPGLFREPIAVLGHDSVRRKMPGPINLTFSPLPRGRSLGQERAQLNYAGAENMTRAQCHWSPRARGLKSPRDEHHANGTIDALDVELNVGQRLCIIAVDPPVVHFWAI